MARPLKADFVAEQMAKGRSRKQAEGAWKIARRKERTYAQRRAAAIRPHLEAARNWLEYENVVDASDSLHKAAYATTDDPDVLLAIETMQHVLVRALSLSGPYAPEDRSEALRRVRKMITAALRRVPKT